MERIIFMVDIYTQIITIATIFNIAIMATLLVCFIYAYIKSHQRKKNAPPEGEDQNYDIIPHYEAFPLYGSNNVLTRDAE